MDTIQQLEKQLTEAKQKEKEAYIESKLSKAREYIGKCYSTHLFHRRVKDGKSITLRKITDIEMNYDTIYYIGIDIRFRQSITGMTFEIRPDSRYEDPFPHWIGSFNHEVSEELFDQVRIETEAHAETYFDKTRRLFKQTDVVTMGDSSDHNNTINMLSEHFNLISLENEPDVKDILSWNNHPFVYGKDTLLDTKESIEIVKSIADKLKNNANIWYGTNVGTRDSVRSSILYNFYKKHKYEK